MLLLWCVVSLSWAIPANPVRLLHTILVNPEKEESLLLEQGMKKMIVLPTRSHAIADAVLKKPSVLGMLNRYDLGENITKDIANNTVQVYKASDAVSQWVWIEKDDKPLFVVVSITKKEMYPIADPFSGNRNEVLFHSIRQLKSNCQIFSGAIDGVVRRWEGSSCSFGSVWMEWNPTNEYSFRVLVQLEPSTK